jgi:ubiquinone/menaquinone biosynthesis C-methylase UbiE
LDSNPLTLIVLIIAIIAGLGALLWWLLIHTEGVYLGQRVVTLLYDLYATRYDSIKQYDPVYEEYLLARPIMEQIAPQTDPLILDVATGTGRLPIALCDYPSFGGQIFATDISRRMLAQARQKLADESKRVTFLLSDAECLPFPDDTFDIVTCLEALEFTASPAEALRECVRVLRPGGLLLITNRIHMQMPGRLWQTNEVIGLLDSYGVSMSQSEPWQVDYEKIWGVKDDGLL